jgi:hypothetical protein
VVRGYVIGSGWKDYQRTGAISGIKLPPGLKQAAKLPQTLFTPSTKAAMGEHDETISFERATEIVGADVAARVRDTAIRLYEFAAEHARQRALLRQAIRARLSRDAGLGQEGARPQAAGGDHQQDFGELPRSAKALDWSGLTPTLNAAEAAASVSVWTPR